MARISRKNMIIRRLDACRRTLKLDTQHIRVEIVGELREIFGAARILAQNCDLELKEREKWARVAAYAAQTIDGLCTKFDEREIDTKLTELGRLVDEAEARIEAKKLEDKNGQNHTAAKSPD